MAEEIKGLLKQHGVVDEPVGIDCHFGIQAVDSCRKMGINVIDGNKAMAEARMIKGEDEIECLRTAGSITESAHWEVAKALRPGVTEWQMAGVAAKAVYDSEQRSWRAQLRWAIRSIRGAWPLSMLPTDRVIRPGDLFITDINGIGFQGYRTCFYRTYCVGDKTHGIPKTALPRLLRQSAFNGDKLEPGITNHDFVRAVFSEGKGRWPSPIWPNPEDTML